MKTKLLLTVICVGRLPVVAAQEAFVWLEGESTYKSNFPLSSWAKGDNPKFLSGGDAFGGMANNRTELPNPAFLLYKVTIPEDGSYLLYVRHGYAGNMGEFRVRFIVVGADGKTVKPPGAEEGWAKIDWDVPVVDRILIGQYRKIEWTKHEAIALNKGNYIMDLQCTGPNAKRTEADSLVWGLIDVFCLTTEPFTSRGVLKPGEQPKPAAPGTADYY